VAAASAPAKLGGSTAEEVAARQALRDEVLSTFQSLQSISPYDLLDIPRDADTRAIRSAYSRRASRFHPDRATGDLTGLRDAFQAILVKLGEARETLEDPGRRSYYDAHAPAPTKLRPAAAEPRASTPAKDPTPGAEAAAPPAPNSEADALQAEQVIGQARKLFQDEKYWDCLQLLDTAMPQTQSSKLQVTMRVLWARATAKNPKWLRRAEEALLEIIQRETRHVEAHYELGRIYAASGLTTRAQRMYRRVLELEASHQGAATALNSLLTTRKL
jgi:curved DNA-binding protein CbpA